MSVRSWNCPCQFHIPPHDSTCSVNSVIGMENSKPLSINNFGERLFCNGGNETATLTGLIDWVGHHVPLTIMMAKILTYVNMVVSSGIFH